MWARLPMTMGAPPTMMGAPMPPPPTMGASGAVSTPPPPTMPMGQPGAGAPAMGVGAPPTPPSQAPMGQPGAMPPMGGGYAPQAVAPGSGYGASFVEDFASLNLAPGGGPGGEPGMDPATFPRPGDDEPRPNMELSCDPKYMRLTCGALPSSPSLKTRFGMPLGCIVQPLHPGDEKEVKTAHFGSSGIVRCRRCRTYINPFVQFTDGGRRFRCNVCALPNEVPVDYFCTLDANGVRRDIRGAPRVEQRFG
jgi:protein transport protein SEC24